MPPAIKVEHLSKCYTIGEQQRFRTLRDSLMLAAATLGKGFARRRSKQTTPPTSVVWALNDVSLDIDVGERVGIIGRNGAGKSTLLKILSRIVEPTRGRAEIRGRVASLLEVGTGFHPELTGRENVFLNGAVLGMSRNEIRKLFDQIVDFAEVGRFIDTPVKRYSSGMYVRLAFSVAAHLTPEILMVDEVLAVGDAEFQKKCLGLMRDVSTSVGRTVLFVSHSMAAVQALCTRAIYLDSGRLASIGPVQEVVAAYSRSAAKDLQAEAIVGHDFELKHVRVSTPTGAPLSTFGECSVEVTARSLRQLADAGARIMFEDITGSPVLGLDSNDFVQRVRAAPGQIFFCTFRIKALPLHAGPYRLRVYLHSWSDHLEWEVPGAFDVSLEPVPVYGSRAVEHWRHGSTAAVANVTVRAGE